MHRKPLSIEYIMYTYRLCLLECMNLSDITSAMYTKLAAKKVLEFFSLRLLCIEFFSKWNSYLVAKWLLKKFF